MFSVLMSVYFRENAEHFALSLSSVIEQTLVPNEIVLIKDGRLTPELDQVVADFNAKYPELFKIYGFEENKGLGYALELGLLKCSHELIARMDSDDIARQDRFEKQVNFMEHYPEIDVLSSNIAEFKDTINNITGYRVLPQNPEDIRKFGKKRCPVNHPTVMYRKSSVIKAGNYQHITKFEDYFLWMRMLNQGMNFYNQQECLVYARIDNDLIDRRHGWKYYVSEINCFWKGFGLGYIDVVSFVIAVTTRGVTRLTPKVITRFIYSRFLREKSPNDCKC